MSADEEEDCSPELKALEEAPVKTRTLFHYFAKTSNGDIPPAKKTKANGTAETSIGKDANACSLGADKVPDSDTKSILEETEVHLPEAREGEQDIGPSGDVLEDKEAKPKASISSFFKKISKEEYRKNVEDQSCHQVIVTKAQVHAELPGSNPSESIPNKKRRRRASSVSNVSRSSDETDVITVVHSEVKILEDEAAKDGNPIVEHIEETKKVLPVGGPSEEVANKVSNNLSNGYAADDKHTTKITLAVFKKKSPKNEAVAVSKASDDNSVDFDFFRTAGAEDSKEPKKTTKSSPQLFKPKPKRRKGHARDNYDSDSIDVDVLATLSSANVDSSSEDSRNPFNTLMRKPILQMPKQTSDSESSPEVSFTDTSVKARKEQPEAKGVSLAAGNNAFTRVMNARASSAKGKGADVPSESGRKRKVEPATDVPKAIVSKTEEKENVAEVVGSPSKSKRSKRDAESRAPKERVIPPKEEVAEMEVSAAAAKPEEEPDSREEAGEAPDSNGRRLSSRIRRNQETTEQKRREREAHERQLDEELGAKSRKARARRAASEASDDDSDADVKVEKLVIKNKEGRLAPIFAKGKKKAAEDPAVTAARKAFLMSSAPEALRAQIESARTTDVDADLADLAQFSAIGHVRQIDWEDQIEATANLGLKSETVLEVDLDSVPFCIGAFNTLKAAEVQVASPVVCRMSNLQIYRLVKVLRMCNEGFPVKKMFRRFVERKIESDTLEEEARTNNANLNEIHKERMQLRHRQAKSNQSKSSQSKSERHSKKESCRFDPTLPSSMQWTMKYAPQCADDVIGNLSAVRKLKSWLEERRGRTRAPRKRGAFESSSDSDDDDSFSEYEDSLGEDSSDSAAVPHTALVRGPSGVGKTAAVYALAQELGFNVLEVNASSSRSGRHVLAQLHEATQSHHVHKRKDDNTDGGKTSNKAKKKRQRLKDRTKKSKTDGAGMSPSSKMTLILFEDVDVVFEEQDEGFYAAINNLIATTKRPIILTTSSANFTPKRFLRQEPDCFSFKPVTPSTTAKYLQLLCLAEGFPIDASCIEALVHFNEGVISMSVFDLQLFCTSGGLGQLSVQRVDAEVDADEDESSDGHDSLAKLLSLKEGSTSSEVVGLFRDRLFLSSQSDKEPMLAEDLRSHLNGLSLKRRCDVTSEGLASFMMLPFALNKEAQLPKRRFSPSKEDPERVRRFKRIAFDSSLFCADSENEDADVDVQTASTAAEVTETVPAKSRPPSTERERKAFGNARRALLSMAECADVCSNFLHFPDKSAWWTTASSGASACSRPAPSDLALELAAFVQTGTWDAASAAVRQLLPSQVEGELTVSACADDTWRQLGGWDEAALRCADRDVLNALLPDLTVCPGALVPDYVGAVRGILRMEEVRKQANTSGPKRARTTTNRFRHHFADTDLAARSSLISTLCNTFY